MVTEQSHGMGTGKPTSGAAHSADWLTEKPGSERHMMRSQKAGER